MSSSLIPTVLDALLAQLRAALPNLEVRDGAVLQDEERTALYVGADLDGSDWAWEQRWAGLGHATRDEAIEIPCLLFVRSGDTDLKASRDEVFATFATVEASLRSTPNLGLSGNSIRAQLLPSQYSQPQTPDGVVCRLRFIVNVEGRI